MLNLKYLALSAAMALATGLGMSMPTEAAQNACLRRCSTEYTQCWYSCTPGVGACYDMCRDNYYNCAADCP